MSCNANQLVSTALKYKGVVQGSAEHKTIVDGYNTIKPLPRNYKVKYTDAWCATFVSFCALKSNALDIIPAECSCENMIKKAKSMGIWREDENYFPNIGDIIMYDWDDNGVGDCTGRADHVGIVYGHQLSVKIPKFEIIEGNNGGKVSTRILEKNARYIRGFIIPKYLGTTPKSFLTVVEEVIAGKWGSGATRRQRLTLAGYDWREVQNEVNKKLGSDKHY